MGISTRRRAGRDLSQLIHHSDHAQYRATRFTDRLAHAELVRKRGSWRGINDLEIATAVDIDWFNHRRLHGEIGYRPPIEVENELLTSSIPTTRMERV